MINQHPSHYITKEIRIEALNIIEEIALKWVSSKNEKKIKRGKNLLIYADKIRKIEGLEPRP
jgi:hypothetical protein